jgi:lysophospholipase L1-like esterase
MIFRVFLLLALSMTASLAAPFRVVCLGDSITGPGPENASAPAALDPVSGKDPSQQRAYLNQYAKYADLLGLVLETHLGEGKVQVINRGWAGIDSTRTLARMDAAVVALKPQVVTILIGGNDFGGGITDAVKERLHTNLSAIVDKCKAAGAKVLLLEYATPRADDMTNVWTHLNAGNPTIAQVAKEKNVPTLELAPHFDEAAKTHPLSELASPHDGVHYNPYGEFVTARAIYFKLRELGWLPR